MARSYFGGAIKLSLDLQRTVDSGNCYLFRCKWSNWNWSICQTFRLYIQPLLFLHGPFTCDHSDALTPLPHLVYRSGWQSWTLMVYWMAANLLNPMKTCGHCSSVTHKWRGFCCGVSMITTTPGQMQPCLRVLITRYGIFQLLLW